MISALHLGNFKGFAETQRSPIRPITLTYGPNTAGKSSLIHGLVLARHAIETGDLYSRGINQMNEKIQVLVGRV